MPERRPFEPSTRYLLNNVGKRLKKELRRSSRQPIMKMKINEAGSALADAATRTVKGLPKAVYEDVSRRDSYTWGYIINVIDQLEEIYTREDTGDVRKVVDSLLYGAISLMLSPLIFTGTIVMDTLTDKPEPRYVVPPDNKNVSNKRGKRRNAKKRI